VGKDDEMRLRYSKAEKIMEGYQVGLVWGVGGMDRGALHQIGRREKEEWRGTWETEAKGIKESGWDF